MQSIKPNRLKKEDTIAIISPSFPAISLIQRRLERAEHFLKTQLGFKVVFAPNAGLNTGYSAGSAKQRADDLNWAFANRNVNGIMTAIGGLNSNAMLPYLDFDITVGPGSNLHYSIIVF